MRAGSVLGTEQFAWIAVLPCALLTVALVVLLGPPLGHAFLGPGPETFWPERPPEPVEHGRYLLALLGPAALAAAVLASARWPLRLEAGIARRLVRGTQLALPAFVALCIAAQYDVLVSANLGYWGPPVRYFTLPTLLVALALPALRLALMRSRPALAARAAGLARETRARRVTTSRSRSSTAARHSSTSTPSTASSCPISRPPRWRCSAHRSASSA